jgi:hypothetical protein
MTKPTKTKSEVVEYHNELVSYEPTKMHPVHSWSELLPHQQEYYAKTYNVIEDPNLVVRLVRLLARPWVSLWNKIRIRPTI